MESRGRVRQYLSNRSNLNRDYLYTSQNHATPDIAFTTGHVSGCSQPQSPYKAKQKEHKDPRAVQIHFRHLQRLQDLSSNSFRSSFIAGLVPPCKWIGQFYANGDCDYDEGTNFPIPSPEYLLIGRKPFAKMVSTNDTHRRSPLGACTRQQTGTN